MHLTDKQIAYCLTRSNEKTSARDKQVFRADQLRRRQQIAEDMAEAVKTLETDLKNPDLICERTLWLLQGCYGHCEQIAAFYHLANSSHIAAVLQLILEFEWGVPYPQSEAAYTRALDVPQRATLMQRLETECREYLVEITEEETWYQERADMLAFDAAI